MHARAAFIGAALSLFAGYCLAARHYPGGFDWQYMVMSALASQRRNPDGASWFGGALALGMLLLWPVVQQMGRAVCEPLETLALRAIKVGLLFGILTGIERAFFDDYSSRFDKGHELLAAIASAGLYLGLIALCITRFRRTHLLPLATIAVALLAAGGMEVVLWLAQRELGWVGVAWREAGIPAWRSFALWQWTAAAIVLASFGYFAFSARAVPTPAQRPPRASAVS